MCLYMTVIRPRLPMDVLQGHVGETEDVLVSLFEAALQHEARNVLVLLDDLEYIVGGPSADVERHFIRRCRSTFFTMFDFLQGMLPLYCKSVMFICTTSIPEVVKAIAVRFDRVVQLEPPNAMERDRLVQLYFPLPCPMNNDSASNVIGVERNIMQNVVESTVGKSYAELVQLCRQSLETVALLDPSENDDVMAFNRRALLAMKERLQTTIPESLRSEYVDGYVDMRVWSARDLLDQFSIFDSNNVSVDYDRQLHASPSASVAWKVLRSSIILPLCKSKELRQLMDSSAEVPKSLVGAVLLAGEPGSGKSALALHCARHAAMLLPSMKLMEVTCTSLVHKEVGASEQAIQHLFAAARRAAPAIVLMDGIETIAATRGNDSTTEGTMDRILSTLLIELDGIDSCGGGSMVSGIAVIGITRDASWIDPALKRPGRFDRVLHVSRDWD
jgi:SpoVK/Ycf46/Vps4 family AAA+-type ATPase